MILSEQSVDKMIFSGKNINKNKYIYGFYYLSGGLSQIIENLRKKIIVMGGEIQTGVCIENIILPVTKKYPFSTVLKTSSDVFKSSFHESSLTILGKYNEKKFEIVTNNCILALPKQELMKLKNSPKRSVGENHFAVAYEGKMTNLFKEHIFRDIFDKIYCGSLCRIYTKFRDGSWFENLSRFTTQNDLRMVIPMNPKNGTMMISYSDNIYADRWNKLYKTSGMRTMKKRLRELLSECLLFDVPPLGFTRIFYWECGVGYWSIGANSKKISKKMTKPFPNENIFVCGEHYSANHQQWMEGALETSLRVVSQLSL
jgi:hypothetical protein